MATDGQRVIVGAAGHVHVGVPCCGAAYVFKRAGGAWVQEQELWASETSSQGDGTGWAVTIDGDNALVAGVGHLPSGPLRSAVYFFRLNGSTWTQQQQMFASTGSWQDRYGGTLAIRGDEWAAIGASGDSTIASAAGAVYVYRLDGRTLQWIETQKLFASDAFMSDGFGGSLALSGDTLLIGAPGDDHPFQGDAGSAYVFRLNSATGQWTQEQKLTVAEPLGIADTFGWSVALDGDVAMIGARAADPADRGAAYIFRRHAATGLWALEQKLQPTETWCKQFGRSVALKGGRALGGAGSSNPPGSGWPFSAGAAFMYRYQPPSDNPTPAWVRDGPALLPNPGGGPSFGDAAAMADSFAVVGAPGEWLGGAAYIFTIDPAPADLNCDGRVTGLDLALLLGQWTGLSQIPACPPAPAADLNGDCRINGQDLAIVLGAWMP